MKIKEKYRLISEIKSDLEKLEEKRERSRRG